MKIGIFTDTYPPYINGVSTSIEMLKRGLEKLGHDVYIVTVNDNLVSYDIKPKIIRIPGIPVKIFDYRLTSVYPVRALDQIKKWDLDIIHSHTEFGVGTFARIIAKQYDIPLVHTYHTMYEDYVHYITKGYFNKSSKKIVEYLTKFYCDKTAEELIVPTKKTYDLFIKKYKVNKNIHIIPTGIEVERFYKEKYNKKEVRELKTKLGFKEDDFINLFVGRMGKEKSVDFLIDAQKDISKKYPNSKLVIIGDGPYIDILKKQASKQNNVVFLGKIPWDEIPKYYQIANIFSSASKTETQGLTIIEAMAASLPVVAINDEAFTNVVIDGLNGCIFSNKKAYKKNVINLIKNSDKLKTMSKQARITSESHSSKYFVLKVLDVYENIVSKKQPKKSYIGRLKNQISKVSKWKK